MADTYRGIAHPEIGYRPIALAGALLLLALSTACSRAPRNQAERFEVTTLEMKAAGGYLPSIMQLPKDARRFNDLVVTPTPEEPLLLDLYLPAKSDGPLPLIIWVHGGGWHSEPSSRQQFLPGRMVGRGYALASITYRSARMVRFPAQIEDCKASIRWLRAHAKEYGIDPNRVGVWGISAGGHLTALIGTSGDVKKLEGKGGNRRVSSRVQAACDFCGPTDFLKIESTQPTSRTIGAVRFLTAQLVGGDLEQHRDLVTMTNPITYASRDTPPMLIMHGDLDPLVPVPQSEILYEALKAKGANVKLGIAKGGGHLFVGPEVDQAVDAFFDENLKTIRQEGLFRRFWRRMFGGI